MDAAPQATPDTALCTRCGYSLLGLPQDTNCPLCGTPTPGSVSLPAAVPAAATCIRCAYSLNGLQPNGICPECGTPIERSLRGDLLLYSDPDYIRKLLAGARLVFWSMLSIIGLMAAAIFFLFNNDLPLAELDGMAILAALITFVCGWWLITWPDVGQLSTNKGQRPRRIVRVSLIIILAIVGAISIVPYLPFRVTTDARILTSLLIFPAIGVGFCAGMLYLRWLAPRIPDGRVFYRAKALLVLLGCSTGAVVLGVMFEAAGRGAGACFAGLLLLAAGLANLAAVVMYCRLFFLLRNSLQAVARAQGTPHADPSS